MSDCFVYIIAEKCTDPETDKVFVKVGVSSNPYARLAQLQTGCPTALYVVKVFRLPTRWMAFEVEQHYHNVNAPWSAMGEWTRSIPNPTIDEVGGYCAEIWVKRGISLFEVAQHCDRAGISCAAMIQAWLAHHPFGDE